MCFGYENPLKSYLNKLLTKINLRCLCHISAEPFKKYRLSFCVDIMKERFFGTDNASIV